MFTVFICNKLKKSYSKNLPEFLALKDKLYPEFVFERNPKTLRDEIPVFTLHSVEPEERFEDQLRFCTVIVIKPSLPMSSMNALLAADPLQAVCFLIPGLILESATQTTKQNGASDSLCTWDDIREMHDSGVIDFQSHSIYHNLVFVSPAVEDFIYPSFDCFAKNLNVPLFRVPGRENISRRAQLGTPIYRYAPKFAGKQRYFDDEKY